ncbi:hypothetical protein [Aquimarina agarivorans]|uniref:hypothetical protein n=1 Tax=Aquimarina agarivorans TaxID=980584 RepID=UPI000248FD9E|nr:hypothetical protein [Aquimarina agarivorans]
MNYRKLLKSFLPLFAVCALASCEKKDAKEVDSAMFNEMNVVSVAIKEDADAAFFAFTPNNINYLDLDYNWYVNGELQSNAPSIKSLFQYKFVENGNFTICFESTIEDNKTGALNKICTDLTISNLKNNKVEHIVATEE